MKTVWKFQLPPHDGLGVWLVDFQMPENAVPLSAALQDIPSDLPFGFQRPTRITIWVQIDNTRRLKKREFAIVGTGFEVPQPARFLSTIQDGPYVWHVFDLGEAAS